MLTSGIYMFIPTPMILYMYKHTTYMQREKGRKMDDTGPIQLMGKLKNLLGGQEAEGKEAGQLQRPEGRKSLRVQEECTGIIDDKVFGV